MMVFSVCVNDAVHLLYIYMCPCSTKAVISNTGIFVAIDNNTLYESKLYIFILCQKSLRSCSMKIFSKFPTVNISKLNY